MIRTKHQYFCDVCGNEIPDLINLRKEDSLTWTMTKENEDKIVSCAEFDIRFRIIEMCTECHSEYYKLIDQFVSQTNNEFDSFMKKLYKFKS